MRTQDIKPSPTPKPLALGYVRVSTPRQAMDGVSLDAQFDKIKAYCNLNDLDLVGLYGDPGISGKTIADRPGVQCVLELAQEGRISRVVVYKLARLGRDTREMLDVVYKLRDRGVRVQSVMEQFDTETPVGKLVLAILAAVAELDRDTISENTLVAMNKKRENGGRVGRFAPLGYRLEGDNVVPDPREQQVIRQVEMYRKLDHTYQEISDLLAEDGYYSRTGKPYSKGTLHKMMNGGD